MAEPGLQAVGLEGGLRAGPVEAQEVQVPDRGQGRVRIGDSAGELLVPCGGGVLEVVFQRAHPLHKVLHYSDVAVQSLALRGTSVKGNK